MSLRLNDLTVQKRKVRDQIGNLQNKQSAAKEFREKIHDLEAQEVELERLIGVEEQQQKKPKVGVVQLGNELRKAAAAGELDAVNALCSESNVKKFVNSQNFEGTTALIKAAIHDHEEIISALVAAGAKVELTDERGRTALMMAAGNGCNGALAKLLSTNEALDSIAASNGWNAFMFAAQGGHVGAGALLVEACGIKACMGTRDLEGKTVVDLVETCADAPAASKMIDYLKKVIADAPPLHGADDDDVLSAVAKQLGSEQADALHWHPMRQLKLVASVTNAFEMARSATRRRDRGDGKDLKTSFVGILRQAAASLLPSFMSSTLSRERTSTRARNNGVKV